MADENEESKTPSADAESKPEAAAEEAAADTVEEPAAEAADAAETTEAESPAAEASSEGEGKGTAEESAAESGEDVTEAPAEAAAESAPEEPAAEQPPVADPPQHTYEELHAMNVNELRDVAAKIDHEAVHGYSTMHKEHLVPAICKAIGIEAHEHHEVVGIDKGKVKAKIQLLKQERDEAEAAGDSARLKLARRRIRGLKRKIRKATV